jgi:hypothetical protein
VGGGVVDIYGFWRDVLGQDAERIRGYFREDAYVNWHCTNEHFSVQEYLIANCEYPGEWDGEVERVEEINDLTITVTHVYPKDRSLSFHVTSFFQIPDGRIQSLDEYWADDGTAPDWRLEKKIGTKIR